MRVRYPKNQPYSEAACSILINLGHTLTFHCCILNYINYYYDFYWQFIVMTLSM